MSEPDEPIPPRRPAIHRLGWGMAKALLAFAPAFAVTVVALISKFLGLVGNVPSIFGGVLFVFGFWYLFDWTYRVIPDRDGATDRTITRVLVTMVLLACNLFLAVAGCLTVYPLNLR